VAAEVLIGAEPLPLLRKEFLARAPAPVAVAVRDTVVVPPLSRASIFFFASSLRALLWASIFSRRSTAAAEVPVPVVEVIALMSLGVTFGGLLVPGRAPSLLVEVVATELVVVVGTLLAGTPLAVVVVGRVGLCAERAVEHELD